MPAAHPEEFRRRAVELARMREKPIAVIAKDLGISGSCPRRWMGQADIDEGHKEGLSRDERVELVKLRREEAGAGDGSREILKRASA
jgi:transposase